MPKALGADAEQIHELYKIHGATETARIVGVPRSTVTSMASRNGWENPRKHLYPNRESRPEISNSVTIDGIENPRWSSVVAQLLDWSDRIGDQIESVLAEVESDKTCAPGKKINLISQASNALQKFVTTQKMILAHETQIRRGDDSNEPDPEADLVGELLEECRNE